MTVTPILQEDSTLEKTQTINKNRPGNTAGRTPSIVSKAMWAMRFAVLIDAISSQGLAPNYALLVMQGGTPVSRSIDPLVEVATAPSFPHNACCCMRTNRSHLSQQNRLVSVLLATQFRWHRTLE